MFSLVTGDNTKLEEETCLPMLGELIARFK